MSKILDEKELVKMLIDFYEDEFTDASPEKKQKFIDSYRKAEAETNKEIEEAGSVEAWYASGQGRLMNF